MIIEIKGTGFKNKGAELMLHAILQRVREEIPNVKFVMKPNRTVSYLKRAELGIFHKLDYQQYKINFGVLIGSLLPREMRWTYGMIREDEIDVVLDASGLSYSEKWGISSTKKAAKQYKRMKKNGSLVIMLPQAFGPFENPEFNSQIKIIERNADLIFARDKQSREHLLSLLGESQKINIAPDFTNLVESVVHDQFKKKNNDICMIPNYRMIDKTDKNISSKYTSFMTDIAVELTKRGESIFLLIHEGEQDADLAQQIVDKIGGDVSIVKEPDPLKIKGIISESKGVISSRFHGLVSALSQGVPALATGWNHKYEMLFQDYKFSEGMLDVDMPKDRINSKLDYLCNDKKREQLSNQLINRSSEIIDASEEMWKEVLLLIKNRISVKKYN